MAAAVLGTSKGLIRIAPLSRLEQAENSEAITTPAGSGVSLAKMYSRGFKLSPLRSRKISAHKHNTRRITYHSDGLHSDGLYNN